MIEIKHRFTGAVLRTVDAETLAGADLTRAYLVGADLRGADLTYADLTDANLRGENLTRANLRGANLTYANLTGARLVDADLTCADLTCADLTCADLRGANLRDAVLPDGSTVETYDPRPVFAGPGAAPVPAEAWTCNSWDNCPLHHAYGAKNLTSVPVGVRAAAATWLALYDGHHACALRGLR